MVRGRNDVYGSVPDQYSLLGGRECNAGHVYAYFADGWGSTSTTFVVGDATPVITSVSPSGWNAGTTTNFTLAGSGFGTNPSLSIGGSGILSYSLLSGSDNLISGSVTIDASAPAGNATVTVTSNGYYGQPFDPVRPGQPQQGTIATPIYPLTVSQSPSSLKLSTGDTNVTVSVSVTPSTMVFTPAFSFGLQSNPNSSCNFQRASLRRDKSLTQLVVPPQVMIQTLVGEAGAQVDSGDDTMPAVLLVAKNRFGDSAFPGGSAATWQGVLVPGQFYGASNPTATGVQPELRYASEVFAATTGVTIPAGCEAYWSPTNSQFSTLQAWTTRQANSIADSDWPTLVGAPGLWNGRPKQAVIKSSIANNKRTQYTSAPAIILFRPALTGTDPAVVTIP